MKMSRESLSLLTKTICLFKRDTSMKENSGNIFNIDENGVIFGLCDTLTIPEGVISLERACLNDYDFLSEVNIPASCESIKDGFMERCDNVRAFHVAEGNQHFTCEDGVLYTADKSKLIRYPAARACEVFSVPNEVEIIEGYAFAGAKSLSGVLIGKKCRSIKENAFVNTTYCTYKKADGGGITGIDKHLGIRKYYISPAVQDIGDSIFEGGWEEDGLFYDDILVGGAVGSAIWEHCNKCNIPFLEVSEDDAEAFLATPYEKLLERHKKESESPISFEFTDEGFGGRIEGDTLELFALDPKGEAVAVCKLDLKLPKNRYENIKKLVIGDGICTIDKNAFWDFYSLESIYFGKDLTDIKAAAFYNDYKITELALDARNQHYKCIDGIIFSSDLKTLVLYPSGKEDAYYEIPPHVEIVGPNSMMCSKLKCIKFGSNVKKICEEACYNTLGQHHFYVAPSVTEFGDDFIFGVTGRFDVMCVCMRNLVVGGKAGSPIEKYCKETGRDGISFEVVEDDKLDEWLAPPQTKCEF
jgi:hypothetical protein